jgi:hypothetical protein
LKDQLNLLRAEEQEIKDELVPNFLTSTNPFSAKERRRGIKTNEEGFSQKKTKRRRYSQVISSLIRKQKRRKLPSHQFPRILLKSSQIAVTSPFNSTLTVKS